MRFAGVGPHQPPPASPAGPPVEVQVSGSTGNQQQQQVPHPIQPSCCPNSSPATAAATTTTTMSQQQQQQVAHSPEPKISFHLKTSIFTRRITIDSDKMALGLIKQLAIGFLNEIYFQHSYPPQSYIGDYLRRNYTNVDQLNQLYERLILRKYSPDQDSFQPFYSAGDIQPDSFISIELSEREPRPSGLNTPTRLLSPLSQQQTFSSSSSSSITLNSSSNSSNHLAANSSSSILQAPLAGTVGSSSNLAGAPTKLKISHDFHTESFFMPTHCASCSALIKGVFKQGFQCAACKKNYCPKCKLKAEATGEGCLVALAMAAAPPAASSSAAIQQLATLSSGCDSGTSSSSSSASPSGAGQSSCNTNQQQQVSDIPAATNKLELTAANSQHANMCKRKSANNLLHFNIANPFKSHHGQQQQHNASQQAQPPLDKNNSNSRSIHGSAGALDPILQQLSKQMQLANKQQPNQQLASSQQQANFATSSGRNAAQTSETSQGSNTAGNLLNVQATQLSSSHQNLYIINNSQRADANAVASVFGDDTQEAATAAGSSSSAHQSPSKLTLRQQLSNSARNSARDLTHSPTRQTGELSAGGHAFISFDWMQPAGETTCGVCGKPLNGSQSRHQLPVICKTCKLQVHGQCKTLALADCLIRLTESSRAAAAAAATGEQADETVNQEAKQTDLKSTNSNVSRDNIRLHRLAPSVKHVKRPDLTRPIIEGWLQHKTLSDEQSRRHYWRLDETDITLYENDTSTRYFKAIALNKITRVISASSLPKQIKEDIALSGVLLGSNDEPPAKDERARSANTSPLKTSEFRAQMEAMFAFEVTTGSVYLVQALDANEASRWKGSLAAITTTPKPADLAGRLAQTDLNNSEPVASVEASEKGAIEEIKQVNVLAPSSQQLKETEKQQQQQQQKSTAGRHHHHHHHHHNAQTSGAYRGQHKTYTDPNRSRLYNRPRIVIKLDPMSIPDHWIEGKYLIERNRNKGIGFEELGSGQFGKVYAAISEIKADDPTRGLWSGVPVAIKEISKARFDLRQQAKLKNEANILSRLDHPGVIILERVHDLPDKLYIVMEQLEDDMLEMIVSTGEKRLSERVTKFLTYQILEALKYLHSQNIAHCDLKPENVLLCERRSQFPQIKLCDFGFAKIIEENSFRSSLVGTPAYLAPEVVKGERYNRSVDLWSVGVIVYVSLSGEFPFNEGENIHEQISRANFMYPDQPWARISNQAKSFINSLLHVNCDRRLSASRAQNDDWIQDYQLWCDLCELELRVGRRWVTDDADYGRWSRYARQHQLQVPRSAIQLHHEFNGD